MPGATCHEGRDHRADRPPPPAPVWLEPLPEFQTVWLSGLVFQTLRPPTPVT